MTWPNNSDWRMALESIDSRLAALPPTVHGAQLLLSRGLMREAEAALREFVSQSPAHFEALTVLGMLLKRMGREADAIEFLKRAAWVEANRYGVADQDLDATAEFLAAAHHGGNASTIMPRAYVTALFNDAAEQFENLLCGSLRYQAPEILHRLVTGMGPPRNDLHILDLGCGTGLVGQLFRNLAERLVGVDLSPKMLAQAQAKGVYDRLVLDDVVNFLRQSSETFDLILAADLCIYLGNLAPMLSAVRPTLRTGGQIALTVEVIDGQEYCLQAVRRYAHSRGYLDRVLSAAGFRIIAEDDAPCRIESFRLVRSLTLVACQTH